jgi:peptidoglycan-N-acetylglucosamine deacetylase
MQTIPAFVAAGGVCAVTGAFTWAAVAPSSQLFGPTIRATADASTIALTFDDGPNPSVTPSLLELLARHNAHATFFLIGDWVAKSPELAKEIVMQGHTIGNHTQTHPSLVFHTASYISREISRCDDAIEAATGTKSRWMRPPWGFRSPLLGGSVRKLSGGGVVMWSRLARDWKPQPAEAVIRRLRPVQGGDIVLLHDGDHRRLNGDRSHTVAALEYWLPRWKDAGLRFVNLDETCKQS